MKKHTFSRVLSMVLCLVLALSAICLPTYAEKGGEATERRGAITDEDMLHTKGKKSTTSAAKRSFSAELISAHGSSMSPG